MGKSEPSDEDIRNWIKEGWKFRSIGEAVPPLMSKRIAESVTEILEELA